MSEAPCGRSREYFPRGMQLRRLDRERAWRDEAKRDRPVVSLLTTSSTAMASHRTLSSCPPGDIPGGDYTDVVPFVLWSTWRSGTSWLMERLNKHPAVGSYGEILRVLPPTATGWSEWPPGAQDRPFFTAYLRERGLVDSHFGPYTHLFRYLDYVYAPRRSLHAIGFKLMYDQIRPYPHVLAYLRWRSVRVLHLIRENLLDLLLSRKANAFRKRANVWSPEERELIRPRLDTRTLIAELTRLEWERRMARLVVRLLRLPVHEVSYEDLLDSDARLDPIFTFLGQRRDADIDLSPTIVKLAPFSHRDGMANFDEVDHCLRGTRFHAFLRS